MEVIRDGSDVVSEAGSLACCFPIGTMTFRVQSPEG